MHAITVSDKLMKIARKARAELDRNLPMSSGADGIVLRVDEEGYPWCSEYNGQQCFDGAVLLDIRRIWHTPKRCTPEMFENIVESVHAWDRSDFFFD